MPRKKRIAILVIAIILTILIIAGILGYLYLKTDAFKPKETLFAKYLIQNFENINILKIENASEIEEALNNNKYTSQITGTIEYTENLGTSSENKESKINDVGIKINSNVDKINNYDYKDISIESGNEKLLGLEYLNQDETYGIRLNDIQEFASIENNGQGNNSEEAKIYNIEKLASTIDFNSILEFTDEEQQKLANTYIGIIQSNVSSDKYYKQSNAMITINNKSVQANAYSIKLTLEEYNNLSIKILEQISIDETILSRIDLIEDEIKAKYSDYNQEETLREKFVNYINEKIEKIQNNNIGSEEVKLTVYENNMKTVRTSIEKSTEKLTLDLYGESSIKIDRVVLGDNTEEQILKIEKTKSDVQFNTLLEYEKLQDNEIIKNIQLNYLQNFENDKLNKEIELAISNGDYEGILKIEDNTEIVEEFENQITLDTNNVKLGELPQETKEIIKQILNENFEKQLSNLYSRVSLDDYKAMLENLDIIEKTSVQLPINGEVTEIERKRFNSQFEFFVSENLTSDNIKQLVNTAKNNFEDMRILTKDGKVEELDAEKLASSNNKETSDYKKNISEILIYIKQNSNNTEKQESLLEFLDDNKNNKYTVSINYDDNGLVRVVRAKIQEN